MRWCSAYVFKLTVYQILRVIALWRLFKHDFMSSSLLQYFSSDQVIICWIERRCGEMQPGYSTPNFHRAIILFISLAFRVISPTVFNSTNWDYEVIQHILFQGYSSAIFCYIYYTSNTAIFSPCFVTPPPPSPLPLWGYHAVSAMLLLVKKFWYVFVLPQEIHCGYSFEASCEGC